MPQLNPAPWFSIMLMAWTILMTMLLFKMIKHEPANLSAPNKQQKQIDPWNWPWS
uniref:ATP synthase complex subunit 8 n=1 Tax=Luetkenotyphlus brasiliensis TaxID=320582 RepID=W5RH61_LUEBR|nr:ATP synthase F0 subunit 8 [Luetkenotyphlus brasiliensis]AGZ19046.1 ATP synthase F0 subunit 8 [Luetkenotyphlus brasiliensis]